MKLLKLTTLPLLFLVSTMVLTSCEKTAEEKVQVEFSKKGIVLSAAQETPANASTALGFMDVLYSRETRFLTYTVKWSGLTAPPILMHIHGQAPIGFAAGVFQTILSAANPTLFPATGSYSGSLLIDGAAVKEENLLNGFYYMNIHTPLNPGGEIRGQITLN